MSNDKEIADAAREALRVLRKAASGSASDVNDLAWAINRQARGDNLDSVSKEVGEVGKEVFRSVDHLDARLKRAEP